MPCRPCRAACRLFPRCRHRASGLTPPRSPAPTPPCQNCSASQCRVDTAAARRRADSSFPRACFRAEAAVRHGETRCPPSRCWKTRPCAATGRAPSSAGFVAYPEISFDRLPGCIWRPGRPARVCLPPPTSSPPRWRPPWSSSKCETTCPFASICPRRFPAFPWRKSEQPGHPSPRSSPPRPGGARRCNAARRDQSSRSPQPTIPPLAAPQSAAPGQARSKPKQRRWRTMH